MPPYRPRGTARPTPSPGRCPQLHARGGKVGTGSAGGLDLEDLVEAGVLEYVPQVAVDAREPKLAIGRHQPLLGLQQDAKAGAGDVLQRAAVQRHLALDLVQK